MISSVLRFAALLTFPALLTSGCGSHDATWSSLAETQPAKATTTTTSFQRRSITLDAPATQHAAWLGHGVSYGPFRDGQRPGGELPTKEQVAEDLRLISKHWSMIRMYGSRGVAETACAIIKEEKLPLRILVGAWITPEKPVGDKAPSADTLLANTAENKAEVEKAIELANKYPGVVLGVSIGNETLVEWSDHRCDADTLIKYIRQARTAVSVPVTTCDDYNFWNKPHSVAVGKECDYIAVHIYAMWNKQQLVDAMDWTRSTLANIKANHPGTPIVITEIGWATSKGTNGYQAIGIVTNPDEREQELFFRSLRDWASHARQPYFYFSAFDENWKGGTEPNEVEKHWGVFKADRTPKKVMRVE